MPENGRHINNEYPHLLQCLVVYHMRVFEVMVVHRQNTPDTCIFAMNFMKKWHTLSLHRVQYVCELRQNKNINHSKEI